MLIADPFANYVIQNMVDRESMKGHGLILELAELIRSNFIRMSTEKFSSNIVEKALGRIPLEIVHDCCQQLLTAQQYDPALRSKGYWKGKGMQMPDETTIANQVPLIKLVTDKFGNYVVQKLLHVSQGQFKRDLLFRLKTLPEHILTSTTYSKHILYKLKEGEFGHLSPTDASAAASERSANSGRRSRRKKNGGSGTSGTEGLSSGTATSGSRRQRRRNPKHSNSSGDNNDAARKDRSTFKTAADRNLESIQEGKGRESDVTTKNGTDDNNHNKKTNNGNSSPEWNQQKNMTKSGGKDGSSIVGLPHKSGEKQAKVKVNTETVEKLSESRQNSADNKNKNEESDEEEDDGAPAYFLKTAISVPAQNDPFRCHLHNKMISQNDNGMDHSAQEQKLQSSKSRLVLRHLLLHHFLRFCFCYQHCFDETRSTFQRFLCLPSL
jgi:hypothetical protein